MSNLDIYTCIAVTIGPILRPMKLAQLTSADLKRIAALLEQKEALQAQIAQLNSQLSAFEAGEAAPAPAPPAARGRPGRKPGPRVAAAPAPVHAVPARRAKRGAVKAAILDLIKGAGKPGITVKDIAARLGAKYNRVFTWFYTTGRNISQIKKVGPGKYAWTDGAASVAKPAVPPAAAAAKPGPKPKAAAITPAAAPAKRAVGKRAMPGQFKDSVLATVKSAGKAGISVKEIAKKLGLDPQRIYVWFNATGKKVKAIRKVAPATYAWAG